MKTTAPAATLLVACWFIALLPAPYRAHAAGGDKVSPWVTAAAAAGGTTEILVVLVEQADLTAAAATTDLAVRRRAVHGTL